VIVDFTRNPQALPGACDVCVIGGGPAGIVTALELARRRPDWHIVLLEGGGTTMPPPAELDPYVGTSAGKAPYPLSGSRLRFLGGTSNHWGGWCRPFDVEDFGPRPWLARSEWPLERADLEPWYAKAAKWCEIGSTDYAEDSLSPELADGILAVADSALLCNKYFRFSPPTRFGRRYQEALEQTPNLKVLLRANAVGLDWLGERVDAVRIASTQGAAGRLKAGRVVVALGGIETTRFLLVNARQAPPGSGLGSAMLGRCFADHFGLTPAEALLPAQLQYARVEHPTGTVMPVLALRADAQRALATPDFCITLVPQPEAGSLEPAYASNAALGFRGGQHWRYRMQLICEPPANPDNRITLLDEVDRLGVPRLRLDWHVAPDDFRASVASLREVGAELGALGLGRLRTFDEAEFAQGAPSVGFHHLGSARMADNAEGGVVDARCRVHGIENLHVASSATFPACGFSNPTLTIVALAVRLAAHLTGVSGSQAEEPS